MNWLFDLATTQPVAWAVLVLSLVGALGLAISSVKVRGVGIGVTGVLFAGLLFGHLEIRIEHPILEFVREFGLILFVFTIGLQLGPGFFASLRKQGLKLNLLAAAAVLLSAGVALGIAGPLFGLDVIATLGLLSGATTNTPSLAAAQQTLKALGEPALSQAAQPALAYAVAYPGGVVGTIATLLLLRALFRIDPHKEAQAYREEQHQGDAPLERMSLVVDNPNLAGLAIGEIPGHREIRVVVSRIQRKDAREVQTANEQTVMQVGDTLLAVGTRHHLEQLRVIVGHQSRANLAKAPGHVVTRRFVVTRKGVIGRTLGEIDLAGRYGATVTRVARAEIEMAAMPGIALQFGDVLQVVGDEHAIPSLTEELGNSVRALNETNFTSIFVGLALGVAAGMFPLHFDGIPAPVRLGLAGGPLLVAILLSRVGHMGPMIWYMPANANTAFRELGIVLFLACVGLKAGGQFFDTVFTARGLHWLAAGFLVSVIPILVVGLVARLALKMNFTPIGGLLAGSMTDPRALAFANAVSGSDAPSIAYATVYPLTMLLRIVGMQVLVLVFCG
ncbi:MAG: putative transporter [Burkholderiaceae bacterium]